MLNSLGGDSALQLEPPDKGGVKNSDQKKTGDVRLHHSECDTSVKTKPAQPANTYFNFSRTTNYHRSYSWLIRLNFLLLFISTSQGEKLKIYIKYSRSFHGVRTFTN